MLSDLKFALRMLVKSPGFSVTAFLALALGIGVNTTLFGIINTLLLRPLPVGHSEQLVRVFTTDTHSIKGNQANSYLNFIDYAKKNSAFDSMAGYAFGGMGMSRGSETLNVVGLMVTWKLFRPAWNPADHGSRIFAGRRFNAEWPPGRRSRLQVCHANLSC